MTTRAQERPPESAVGRELYRGASLAEGEIHRRWEKSFSAARSRCRKNSPNKEDENNLPVALSHRSEPQPVEVSAFFARGSLAERPL